jgi:hypothetical protein
MPPKAAAKQAKAADKKQQTAKTKVRAAPHISDHIFRGCRNRREVRLPPLTPRTQLATDRRGQDVRAQGALPLPAAARPPARPPPPPPLTLLAAAAAAAALLLQNKNKSAKVQKYVQQVQKASAPVGKPEVSRKEKKAAEEAAARELAAMIAGSIKQPKLAPGVDPKSVVCEFFRAGQCTKGFKCKYSHDLNVERKGPKLDLFADRREGEEEETMEDWTQEELEKAIASKHGAEAAQRNAATSIVCKFFLEAVEKRLYGWFWSCPNGKECKYRHALPPGYVLKSQMKALLEEEAANAKSVEEMIEEERAKVDAKTPVTEEVFAAWKAAQDAARRERRAAEEEERRKRGVITGREIFALEGFVAADDASAAATFEREDEEGAIAAMHAAARAAEEAARAAAGAEGGGAGAGPGGAAVCGAAAALTREEEEDLFGDDDASDEDGMLDALAEDLGAKAAVS